MGAVKGEPHDEEVPTPTAQQAADTAAAEAEVASSAVVNHQQLDEVAIDGGAAGGDGTNVQRLVASISYLFSLDFRFGWFWVFFSVCPKDIYLGLIVYI